MILNRNIHDACALAPACRLTQESRQSSIKLRINFGSSPERLFSWRGFQCGRRTVGDCNSGSGATDGDLRFHSVLRGEDRLGHVLWNGMKLCVEPIDPPFQFNEPKVHALFRFDRNRLASRSRCSTAPHLRKKKEPGPAIQQSPIKINYGFYLSAEAIDAGRGLHQKMHLLAVG